MRQLILFLKILKGNPARISNFAKGVALLSFVLLSYITYENMVDLEISWLLKGLLSFWVISLNVFLMTVLAEAALVRFIKVLINKGYSDQIILYGDLFWMENNWNLEEYNNVIEILARYCHDSIELRFILEEKLRYEPGLRAKVAIAYLKFYREEISWNIEGNNHYLFLLYNDSTYLKDYLREGTKKYLKKNDYLFFINEKRLVHLLWGSHSKVLYKEYSTLINDKDFLLFAAFIPNRTRLSLDGLRDILKEYRKFPSIAFDINIFQELLKYPLQCNYSETRIKLMYSRKYNRNFYPLFQGRELFKNIREFNKKPYSWNKVIDLIESLYRNRKYPINKTVKHLNSYLFGEYSIKVPDNLGELNEVGEVMNNCLKSVDNISGTSAYFLIYKWDKLYAVAHCTRSYNLEIKLKNNERLDDAESQYIFKKIKEKI